MTSEPNPGEPAPNSARPTKKDASCIFWGLMLVTLYIKIEGFDVLPDGIGYCLMAWGCGGLVPLSRQFGGAGPLAYVMAGMWLLSFAIEPQAALVYGLGMAVVNCCLMWTLLSGMRDAAEHFSRGDIARRAEILRVVYVVLNASLAAVPLLGYRSVNELAVLAIAAAVVAVVVQAMILYLILQIRRLLPAE